VGVAGLVATDSWRRSYFEHPRRGIRGSFTQYQRRLASRGLLAFSFFGPSYDEAWSWKFGRDVIDSPVQGVHTTSRRSSYVLGVIGKQAVRTGGAMGRSPLCQISVQTGSGRLGEGVGQA